MIRGEPPYPADVLSPEELAEDEHRRWHRYQRESPENPCPFCEAEAEEEAERRA